MSQLHAELEEQAAQLGFRSVEEAEINGFKVNYDKHELVPDVDQAYKDAHTEWEKERAEVLADLTALREVEKVVEDITKDKMPYEPVEKLDRAIKFIKECHD